MEYSYKFRLYPNKTQTNLIERTLGCCRFIYNRFLAERQKTYQETGETPTRFQQDKTLPALKQEFDRLKEVDSTALQSSVQQLDTAFQNFFRRVKQGIKPCGYPKFKRKHDTRKNYKSKCVGKTIRVLDNKHIQLPKLGSVRCAVSKEVQGRILSATVSCTPSGKYFVALCCTDVEIPPFSKTGTSVGLDLGIHDLAVTSSGKRYPNNKYTCKAEKRLRRLQRLLSRKPKGSKNRAKARGKVARLHERISSQRRDNLHKLTTELVRTNDIICIENLNAKGMMKNHRLAKSVADVSFAELRRQLEYKSAWYGRIISVVDRFFPSSQFYGVCGYQNAETKDLSVRQWTCPVCSAMHDRDINAAQNILREGPRLIA